jgi:hypothetical protein
VEVRQHVIEQEKLSDPVKRLTEFAALLEPCVRGGAPSSCPRLTQPATCVQNCEAVAAELGGTGGSAAQAPAAATATAAACEAMRPVSSVVINVYHQLSIVLPLPSAQGRCVLHGLGQLSVHLLLSEGLAQDTVSHDMRLFMNTKRTGSPQLSSVRLVHRGA